MKTREQMREELIDVMLQNITGDGWFASSVIENGFKGYNNYTNEELLQEYNNYMGVNQA